MADDMPRDRFTDFFTRLVRVPKREIDEQEREYQMDEGKAAKPREIVPRPKQKAG